MRGQAILLAVLLAAPALAGDFQLSLDETWSDVSSRPGCTKADYPDFIIVDCEKDLALWYFTKPTNPAHPGIVKRSIVQQPDGAIAISESGRSYGSDDDQPAFKSWMGSIVALDQQVKDELARKHAGH